MRAIWFGTVVVALALAGPREAAARRIVPWSYEDLLKAADLVVVAGAVASDPAGDAKDPVPDGAIGVDTRFAVRLVLKGEAPRGGLTVLHYRWGKAQSGDEAERRAKDPPNFVAFRTGAARVDVSGTPVDVPAPDYLLFLKKRADGRYEPVSGQIDPDRSVRELFTGLSRDLLFAHEQRPKR